MFSISIILSFQECHFNISRTNRLPIISPAKMSLFKINKKLQSEVCNHEPYGSPPWPLPNPPSRELFFKNGKGSWEGDRKQCSLEEWRVWSRMASQWLSCGSLSLGKLLPGKKRKSSFFLWCMRASPSGLPDSILKKVYFYSFHFWSRCFLEALLINSLICHIWWFHLLMLERTFSGGHVPHPHIGGKVHRLEPGRTYLHNMKG